MTLGRYCWYDLISKDPEKSLKFLEDFFQINGKRSPDYTELSVQGASFGGLMKKPDDQGPSVWVGYIHVESLADSTRKAEELGAKIFMRDVEIPGVGRFSFLQDPQGAFVYLFQPGIQMEDPKVKPGMPCWCELRSQDPEGSKEFYGQLLGYQAREIPGYTMLQLNGQDIAGLAREKDQTGWLFYFLVDNTRQSCAEAVKLGARERLAPQEVPGWGTMAVLEDPTGAVFALWQPAMAKVGT